MASHRQIGEVAELTGLSINTLRHYDQVGLVSPSARSQGGFRLYTDEDITRLLLIRRMKPLGFSLEQMRELIELTDQLRDSRTSQRRLAQLRQSLAGYLATAVVKRDRLAAELAYAEDFIAGITALGDPAAGSE